MAAKVCFEELNFSKQLPSLSYTDPSETTAWPATGGRSLCPKCNRRSWIYCPRCVMLVDESYKELVPQVELPLSITIIKHPLESCTKSTSIPLATISPSVKIFDAADLDDTTLPFDPSKSILLFPSDTATNAADADWSNVDNVVVFEGTWNQATTIYNKVKKFNCQTLKLGNYKTVFWRYNGLPNSKYCDERNLATIESIYFLFREIRDSNKISKIANANFDDMLWFYALQHKVMEERAVKDPKLKSTMRRERARQLNQERSVETKRCKV